MRRLLIPALLGTALAFGAGSALAAAPSLAGTWTGTFAAHPIKLQLAGSAASYHGTYSYNEATVIKGKVKNHMVSVPVKASLVTKNKVVRVTLSFTKTRETTACVLAKNTLTCQATFGTLPIVFKHVS